MNTDATPKKNGKIGKLPDLTDNHVAQFQKKLEPGVPALSSAALSTIKLLNERIAGGRQQLGMIDFEKAKLEGQAQTLRAKLSGDMQELDTLFAQGAKDAGVDLSQPGWSLDTTTGAFTRK